MDRQALMLFAPCGHSVCNDCSTTIIQQSSQCPECRADIILSCKNYILIKLIEQYNSKLKSSNQDQDIIPSDPIEQKIPPPPKPSSNIIERIDEIVTNHRNDGNVLIEIIQRNNRNDRIDRNDRIQTIGRINIDDLIQINERNNRIQTSDRTNSSVVPKCEHIFLKGARQGIKCSNYASAKYGYKFCLSHGKLVCNRNQNQQDQIQGVTWR
jgi:hypothetical protein